MKLTITHLKAPWPEGAKVGDVLELPSVPAWALGKCQPADDDAEVTLTAGKVEGEEGQASSEAKALDKAALKAEAKALGLEFDGRMPAAELAELIAAKKAEQQ